MKSRVLICVLLPTLLCLSFKKKSVENQRLVRVHTTMKDASRTIDFEYNDKGYVTAAIVRDSTRLNSPQRRGSELHTIYEYDKDNKIIREFTQYTYVRTLGTYYYNPDNTIKSVDYVYMGGDREPNHMDYVWSEGRLMGINIIQTKDNLPLLRYFCTYDESGKLSKVEFSSSDTTRQVFYSDIIVDDKSNYISAVKGLSNPFTVFNPDPNMFTANNVTAYRETIFNIDKKVKYKVKYRKPYPVKFTANDTLRTVRYLEYAE